MTGRNKAGIDALNKAQQVPLWSSSSAIVGGCPAYHLSRNLKTGSARRVLKEEGSEAADDVVLPYLDMCPGSFFSMPEPLVPPLKIHPPGGEQQKNGKSTKS